MDNNSGTWPEQNAADLWWKRHSLELKNSVTEYRVELQKRIDQLEAESDRKDKFAKDLKDGIDRLNEELEQGYKDLKEWSKESKEETQRMREAIDRLMDDAGLPEHLRKILQKALEDKDV